MHDGGIHEGREKARRMDRTITLNLTAEEATQLLGKAMSEISESCWGAGWRDGTEDALPPLIALAVATGENQEWGQLWIWTQDANLIMQIADALGHWATLGLHIDGPEYLPYQPRQEG